MELGKMSIYALFVRNALYAVCIQYGGYRQALSDR